MSFPTNGTAKPVPMAEFSKPSHTSNSRSHVNGTPTEHFPKQATQTSVSHSPENQHRGTQGSALWISSLSAAELSVLDPDNASRPEQQITASPNTSQTPAQDGNATYSKHLAIEYDGRLVRRWLEKYMRPKRSFDLESIVAYLGGLNDTSELGKRPFLNPVGEIVWKYEDVDAYLSHINGAPRRLIVQNTDKMFANGKESSWRRTKIRGSVPLAIRMAEWALSPGSNAMSSLFRQALVALPVQLLLSLPVAVAPWEINSCEPSHLPYPAYHWKWPKHARNPLDARNDGSNYEKPENLSSRQRLYRPRQLVVRMDKNNWRVIENPPTDLAYIFISYHWGSFERHQERVGIMAQYMCEQAGVLAYFQDTRCNASPEDKDLLTADVNRMCDVIRGCQSVALLLPDDQPRRKEAWGARMWTLPEGLLAPGKIQVCTWLGRGRCDLRAVSKTELTSQFWSEANEGSNEVPGRILAEHYDGMISLSRLELFTTAIGALKARTTTKDFTGADLAYALMGLLRYRIDPDPTDDLFQVLARLSLANDNDRLIERLISLFPKSSSDREAFIQSFAEKDAYQTYCWDIEPRCQIVGVADEPESVVLSDCRAVPIQWKKFPRMMYQQRQDGKGRFASFVLRSGAWWLGAACTLAATYAAVFLALHDIVDEMNDIVDDIPAVDDEKISNDYQRWLWAAIIIFAGISAVLAVLSPIAVHILYGGPPLQATPHLIAFEGTLPRAEIERIIFGRDRGALHYEPSSTPLARWFRHPYIRRGAEPEWLLAGQTPEPAAGYYWFTLVDTGNLSISLFQARRPPTVAFITGTDGGMLRAVLCSWRFANDCHYRETVIRMPSNTWKQCNSTAWVKVCLHSQEDLFATSNRPRTWLANARPTKASM